MLSRQAFDRAILATSDPATRIETFGALLAKASRTKPIIAGGSAITIYTSGRHTSDDIDVVGEKARLVPVLEKWGFAPEEDPEDHRVYWNREDLGLSIDIVHRSPGSGSGRSGVPRTIETSHGPVRASALEDVIVRRLVFWSRSGKPVLMDQAVVVFRSHEDDIDLEYLEGEVRWEGVEAAYAEMRRLAQTD
jgi:hypothetical protein